MTLKSPFIKPYFEDYDNCKEVQKIMHENECNIIYYSKINEDTNINKYDYIIIAGKNELKKTVDNDLKLYENYKSKLYFIGNYISSYCDYKKYKNILHEIKYGLIIDIFKKYNKKILISNLIQNICLNGNPEFMKPGANINVKNEQNIILFNFIN